MVQKLFLILLLPLCVCSIVAQESYYTSIDGVKGGATIKDALYNLIKEHSQISYGSGSASTWGAFYSTDRNEDNNQVYDMYSAEVRYFGTKGDAISGMNIEHCLPKSWWGGTNNNAYCDLHHLNPSDQDANSRKGNYPLAELEECTWDNGVASVGKATINGSSVSAFEPCDEYKGDFARTYMYMFTCYQDLTYKYTWMNYESSTYPTLKPWAVELLLKWNKMDPVSDKEVARNNAVYAIQGNRNPYIDYPQLAEYVWGDSVDYIFNLDGTVVKSDESADTGEGDEGDDGTGEQEGNDGNYTDEKFSLVTDETKLTVGDSIVFVYGDFIMGEQSGNYRVKLDGVTISGNYITSYPDGTAKFVLEEGTVDGSFAFNEGGLYLSAVSSSKNYLHSLSALSAESSWVVTIGNESAATIEAQGDYTRKYLQYNTSSPRFSCYTGTQKSVSLYAKSPVKTTSVATVVTDAQPSVDVYTLQGVCVKKGVAPSQALEGLPVGLYVVGDKKMYKK